MTTQRKTVLVTGGCGFIGSNFLHLAARRFPGWRLVNVDALTYAGNPESLGTLNAAESYAFEHADICDAARIGQIFDRYAPDLVFHFAAESHVDRSIHGPAAFVQTNVIGTLTLLEACRARWKTSGEHRFHHVSTDEVYGALGPEGAFTEDSRYDPSSPYAASKASSDHLVRSYHRTYGLPVVLTNCSNNYGPYQFPEKLIPLMILNAAEGKPLPVYGRGANVRDWLHVEDHCEAILEVALRGRLGETYNIGGGCERNNLDVVHAIADAVADVLGRDRAEVRALVTFVQDRPGHDFRYAIDATKIRRALGWGPVHSFESGLRATVRWYVEHRDWCEAVQAGRYDRQRLGLGKQ